MVVDESPRMGGYPFLFSTCLYSPDSRAYHSALELDKELLQIALTYPAKNRLRLTAGQVWIPSRVGNVILARRTNRRGQGTASSCDNADDLRKYEEVDCALALLVFDKVS